MDMIDPAPPSARVEEVRAFDLDFTEASERPEKAQILAAFARSRVPHNHVALVVDADPLVAESTAGILREAGWHAVVEHSPAEAGRHMARLGAPQLIVAEIDLPGMDGIRLLERIRHEALVHDTAFIFYTARNSRNDLVHALNAGADGYVIKSKDGAMLMAAVHTVLGR